VLPWTARNRRSEGERENLPGATAATALPMRLKPRVSHVCRCNACEP
jgi:hypothetical protein